MAQGRGFRLAIRAVLATFLALCGSLAFAETLVGSSVESRVTLAFAVDDADLGPWMPEGWEPIAFPGGPLAGANLLLVLADQHAQTDADGNLKDPSAKRFVVFAGLGKQSDGDGVRFYAYRVFSSDMSEDPYGNASLASIARSSETAVGVEGERQRSEEWNIAASQSGEALTLSLAFKGGRQNWAPSEANPYSNRIEGFNRIYRYRQLVDLVMSVPVGKPLAGQLSYSNEIEELADIFDGTEKLIGVLDLPVYARDIFLP